MKEQRNKIKEIAELNLQLEQLEYQLDSWRKAHRFSVSTDLKAVQIDTENSGYAKVDLMYMPFDKLKADYIYCLNTKYDKVSRELRELINEVNSDLNPKPNPNESQK